MSQPIPILSDGRYVILIDTTAPKKMEPGWLVDTATANPESQNLGTCVANFGPIDNEWVAVSISNNNVVQEIARSTDRIGCIVKLWHWKRQNYARIQVKEWKSKGD